VIGPLLDRLKSTLAVAVGILALCSSTDPAPAQEPLPRLELGECPFEAREWLERQHIECGYLMVPERWDVEGTRALRIAVAVVHSASESPQPDPVVFLAGGPGGSTLASIRAVVVSGLWRSLRSERDLVFFDQRGTGYSEPEFCPNLDAAITRTYFEGSPDEERRSRVRRAMMECRERMTAAGVDLGAYHSGSSARDLAALRVALGYEEWNLYGVSYGTRLALVTMRDQPQGIRSVVLEAVSPPNAPEEVLANFDRALRVVFDECTADLECAEDYPDLERRFYAMLDEFDENPLVIATPRTAVFSDGRVVVNGDLAAMAVFNALYREAGVPLVPLIIEVFAARNRDALQAIVDVIGQRRMGTNRGLYLSVECYERAPYRTRDALQADVDRAPGLAGHGALIRTSLDDCDAWHEARAMPDELAAAVGAIPTLILSGAFDPITPPAHGRLAAETLSNAHCVEARTGAHGVPMDACSRQIMLDFIAAPHTPLETACNDARTPVEFLTHVHLNGGIYRVATALRRGPSLIAVAWLGVSLLTMLSALVVWPLSWLRRRVRKRPIAATGLAVVASWVAGVAALSAGGFLAGLVWTVLRTSRTTPLMLVFGVPQSAAPLFLVPWLVLSLGVAALTLAGAAWRCGWWRVPSRIYYSLVSLACVCFVAFLAHWRLF
jgi:pimeloyl-ACP methyl ester carboxylesterase